MTKKDNFLNFKLKENTNNWINSQIDSVNEAHRQNNVFCSEVLLEYSAWLKIMVYVSNNSSARAMELKDSHFSNVG